MGARSVLCDGSDNFVPRRDIGVILLFAEEKVSTAR